MSTASSTIAFTRTGMVVISPPCPSFLQAPLSIYHDAADRLAGMHQIEAPIDLIQRQLMGDQVVDIDLTFHVPVDNARHVRPTAGAAEGGALPDASGDELERPGGDLLARPGDADDDADAPALVTA